MKKKKMQLRFSDSSFAVTEVKELNSSFAEGKLEIMYTGENRNKSFISRESVEDAAPSLYNVPIVCHYDEDENMIGGHDVEVDTDDEGNVRLRDLTVPIGVVPESAKLGFEIKKDENGNEHEYFYADGVLLWKRQPAYGHIVNDLGGKVDHSMEIDIIDGKKNKETKLYEINKFEFSALCLLEAVEPCFEGSELELFSANEIKRQFELMMDDLRQSLKNGSDLSDTAPALSDTDGTAENTEQSDHFNEEGGTVLEKEEFGLSEAAENVTEETVEEAVDTAPAAEEEASEPASAAEEHYELSSNIKEELAHTVRSEMRDMPWGKDRAYDFVDFDETEMTVYYFDYSDFKLYGAPYTMNGDTVTVDFGGCKRKKWAIVDFEEGAPMEDPAVFEHIAQICMTPSEELVELRTYRDDHERAERLANEEAVFSRFEDLEGSESFEAFRNDHEGLTIDEIEEKCFALRGRLAAPAKQSAEQKAPKIIVNKTETSSKVYGGLFEQYGYGEID